MTSPGIQVLLTTAAVALGYAFVCQVRLTSRAEELGSWVRRERQEIWSKLNPVARSWSGGLPALKLLHRRGLAGLPGFESRYAVLGDLERRMLWGMGVGAACLGFVAFGIRVLGWHW